MEDKCWIYKNQRGEYYYNTNEYGLNIKKAKLFRNYFYLINTNNAINIYQRILYSEEIKNIRKEKLNILKIYDSRKNL